jgi:uncharacterized membrane protein YecN with MAPEG domain
MTTRINRLLLAMLLFIAAHLSRLLPPDFSGMTLNYASYVVLGVASLWQAARWAWSAIRWMFGEAFQDE